MPSGEDRHRAADADPSVPARPCPICGKPAVPAVRPFCSKRCADVDLHRWLGGVYAIPAKEADGASRGAADEGGGEAGDEDGAG